MLITSSGYQGNKRGGPSCCSVQSLSHVSLFVTPWTAARQSFLSSTSSWSLLKLMSVESVIPSIHPLLLLPSIFPSIRVSSNESVLHIRWPKYWSFSFSISPSNEFSRLISFRIDWFDLLADSQESSKASILWHSALFIVQLSHFIHDYWKNQTRQTFVGKVISLLFNMLSKSVITFLLRSKHLLISWLQSPSAVILVPKKYKVSHYLHCFPIYLPWSDGTRCHDLCFLNVEFKANFFTFLFHFHQEGLYFFALCHKGGIICVSEVTDFLLAILIPAYASPSPAFCMMYSAYKLNKQGDNIQL